MSIATIAAASGEECILPSLTSEQSVFRALTEARGKFGGKTIAIVDGDERALSYDAIIRAVLALGHALRRGTQEGETVGVMLPTGAGAIIAFFALSAYGRVPAMLNFTAGAATIKSALKTTKITRIVTARRFIKLGKFDALAAELAAKAELIYLEDVRDRISLTDKMFALLGSVAPGLVTARAKPGRPAAVLFTSGTEGAPKGVALSHANLLANAGQVRAHIELFPSDILFNPLPVFHCFGLTVGSLLPMLVGVKVVCHPTPLQPREIVRRIRDTGATILLSTDTFLSQYGRAANDGELSGLRVAVCGAERLRDETRNFFRKRYDVTLLEGYGVTEASPVVAANRIEKNRPGTVGDLMAGMEARLEPVEGIANGGRFFIRGPNIMLGYILPDNPGVIVPPPDGWYDTGDIAQIDDEGFISIRGRLKRFAKIGGEQIALGVVENCAAALWPDSNHAAIAIPDAYKGEQIVLITDCPQADRPALIGWAQNHGVTELAVPRKILHVETLPTLGTGKMDYAAIQKMAEKEGKSDSV